MGCGTGQTTRDAARTAAPGAVLGVDLSAAMLRRARALTASADPVTAFTNIARALRTDARLVMLVWQSRERNEWASALYAALGTSAQESRLPATLAPFTLADKSATSVILGRSGFHNITFGDVHEPMVFGPTPPPLSNTCTPSRTSRTPLQA
ncbi:class I SAM-dependent methyltransferase [Nonomuraea sp. 10N515B]|uniref:class I SAM-dependent methyltransferase n=1 Tax=Nonomuraea sp. 10N515B TaxID=3457422 RepID=UPI003FCCFA97